MKKFLILATIVLFFVAGCATNNTRIVSVVKINQTNASPLNNTSNISTNVSVNLSSNLTVNITSNLTNITSNITANVSATASQNATLKNLTVEFIDLNGNSILIRTPSKKLILIDGGDNSDGLRITKYLISKGITKLDYVFDSNAEIDNVGGLASIIYNFNDSQAYYPGISYDTNNNIAYMHYISYSKTYSKSAIPVTEDKEFDMGDGAILSAFVPYENNISNGAPINDTIVFRLDFKDASFLFLGDCKSICFEKIKNKDISADVLKVNGFVPQEIIDAVSPKIIIYDNLKNETIKPAGVKVYSKADGTVFIMSDGNKYFISTTGKA